MFKAKWADVSEHNGRPVNVKYKRKWLAIRGNDGTYRDSLFYQNLNGIIKLKQIIGFFVYVVWPRSMGWCSWSDAANTLKTSLGNTHRPKLVIIMDVESWDRFDLTKDFSTDLESMRQDLVKWLYSLRPNWQKKVIVKLWYRNRDNRRVIGYGNRGDLQLLAGGFTKVQWKYIILADYTPNTVEPKKFLGWKLIGRQYTNGQVGDLPRGTDPWNNCDMNRSFYGSRSVAGKLGLGRLRWSLK